MYQAPIGVSRSKISLTKRVASIGCCLAASLILGSGCQKSEDVTFYTVAKPPVAVKPRGLAVPAQATQPGRILGAIVPHGAKTWFFKVTGPADVVASRAEQFLKFIRTLTFEGEIPRWSLLEGWIEQPGNQDRFATVVIPDTKPPLKLTISALSSGEGNFDDYLLLNINRWRGQLLAPPLAPEDLPQRTVRFDVGEIPVWLVNIEGTLAGRLLMDFGDIGSARPAASPENPPRENGTNDSRKLPLTFQLPEGWTPRPAGPMRMAQFEVAEGEQKVVISISTAGGDLVANVNLWRAQVRLPSLAEKELLDSLQKISVGNVSAPYAELIGPEESGKQEAIFGVIVDALGKQWFLKLQGPADLAKREQPRFEQFVRSIRFDGAEGKSNGQ